VFLPSLRLGSAADTLQTIACSCCERLLLSRRATLHIRGASSNSRILFYDLKHDRKSYGLVKNVQQAAAHIEKL
jgi:hypothetical protein